MTRRRRVEQTECSVQPPGALPRARMEFPGLCPAGILNE
jgi:hypothetical protein